MTDAGKSAEALARLGDLDSLSGRGGRVAELSATLDDALRLLKVRGDEMRAALDALHAVEADVERIRLELAGAIGAVVSKARIPHALIKESTK